MSCSSSGCSGATYSGQSSAWAAPSAALQVQATGGSSCLSCSPVGCSGATYSGQSSAWAAPSAASQVQTTGGSSCSSCSPSASPVANAVVRAAGSSVNTITQQRNSARNLFFIASFLLLRLSANRRPPLRSCHCWPSARPARLRRPLPWRSGTRCPCRR